MKRTQVQIPDRLYNKLKAFARKEEISLAEVIRRAAEYLLHLYPEYNESYSDWSPPEPEDLGDFLADDSEWRVIANTVKGSYS